MALSSVIGLPIKSMYPAMNGSQCKTRLALTKLFATSENSNRETVTVMWSKMGPCRSKTWTGNHFVPVLKQKPQSSSPGESQVPEIDTPVPTKQSQFQPQEISTPISRFLDKKTTTERKPQTVQVQDQEDATPFKQTESSTPASSFLIKLIKDILGNEIKVTQIQKVDCSHDILDPNISVQGNLENDATELNVSEVNQMDTTEPDPNISAQGNLENDATELSVSEVNQMDTTEPDVSDIRQNVSEHSECEDTTEDFPAPSNINQLPQGRWHKAEEIYRILNEKNYVHEDVPPGDKSNSYMVVDNKRNADRFKQNKKCEFYDDCGTWVSKKGNTTKSNYYIDGQNLLYCEIKDGKYCVKKRYNGKATWEPLEPQPENVVVLSKYYATHKENPNFQKHVTFVCKSPDETLSNVALYEYQGEQPKSNTFVRTNPKTME